MNNHGGTRISLHEKQESECRWYLESVCQQIQGTKTKTIMSSPDISLPLPLIFHPLELMITQNIRLLALQSCFGVLLVLFFLPESGRRDVTRQRDVRDNYGGLQGQHRQPRFTNK